MNRFSAQLFRLLATTLCLSCLCVLTGCYIGIPAMVETVNQNAQLTASEGAILESETGVIKKFTVTQGNLTVNRYVAGYNLIMSGSSSLMPSYQILVNKTMRATERDAIPYPLVSNLDKALSQFKSGVALVSGEDSDLDQIVREVIVAGEKLQIDQQNSLPYFRNHIYRKDGLQGGRIVLPILKADYEKLICLMKRMGNLLLERQKGETETRIQYYSAIDSKLRVYIEQSFLDAQELMSYLKTQDAYKKVNAYQYADVLANELLRALDSLKSEVEHSQALWDSDRGIGGVHTKLSEMIEFYRILKQDRKAPSFNRLMKRYSDAVVHYNALPDTLN